MKRPQVALDTQTLSPKLVLVDMPGDTTISYTCGPSLAEQGFAEPKAALRLLVLSVENDGARVLYGDPMPKIMAWGLSRGCRINALYPVYPGARSWYANHPTDPAKQFETQVLDTVTAWNAADVAAGRALGPIVIIGFSASGFGALTLLARNPSVFAGAVAFDAPLTFADTSHYDMAYTYGTDANFIANYRLTDAARIAGLAGKRVVLSGQFLFAAHMEAYAALLTHQTFAYQEVARTGHNWTSGWIADALDRLSAT